MSSEPTTDTPTDAPEPVSQYSKFYAPGQFYAAGGPRFYPPVRYWASDLSDCPYPVPETATATPLMGCAATVAVSDFADELSQVMIRADQLLEAHRYSSASRLGQPPCGCVFCVEARPVLDLLCLIESGLGHYLWLLDRVRPMTADQLADLQRIDREEKECKERLAAQRAETDEAAGANEVNEAADKPKRSKKAKRRQVAKSR